MKTTAINSKFESFGRFQIRHEQLMKSNARYSSFIRLREEAASWKLQA